MAVSRRALRGAVMRWSAAVAAAIVVATGGYQLGAARSAAPAEDSADVGFVRDMVVHHEQAVTLAMIVLTRATQPAVREMAHHIATGQQQEAGVMIGWLQQWALPLGTTTPPMTWMGHPSLAEADPPMPGMATRHDVARLAVTRGPAADLLFCELMQPHHVGALHMVDEILRRGHRPEVLALARQMRADQQKELAQLNILRTKLAGDAH
jgi:uncharacterized protein (DUF305 family)